MNLDDLIFVSVDDHVVEPPDMFDGLLPSRFKDGGPRFVILDAEARQWPGDGHWVVGDQATNLILNYELMRPATWNPDARVREFDSVGLLGSLGFPTFPQFCGQLFSSLSDKALAVAVIRAYNDWQSDVWAASHPDRFIPLALVPLWNPQLMAEEVRRVSRKGTHVVSFSENPTKLGYPSIYDDDHWRPFWTACCDEGTVVATHIGSSSQLPSTSDDCALETKFVLTPLNLYGTAADFVWSNVFRTYGDLKLLLAEGGTGWVPYFLERCDYTWKSRDFIFERYGDIPPSEIFKQHAITCYLVDSVGTRLRHDIGVDNVCWEFDFPHGDCHWPDAPEASMQAFEAMPRDEVDKLTHRNAMRHLRFDPFARRRPEQCTVGSLRTQAGTAIPEHPERGGAGMDRYLAELPRPRAGARS